MSTHYLQMKQKSQFTIGNWAIGRRARLPAVAAFNNVNQSVLKVLVALLMKSSVGQAQKMSNRIKKFAPVTIYHVQHTGG